MTQDDTAKLRNVPTLADVARRANVSTATVSRCLNSPQQVVADTRDRVLLAVRELGYAPNFSARALAARRTNTIGAIIPTMDNAIFARGIQAFQEELRDHGVTLLIASSQYRADLEAEQVRTLTARGADALLLIGHDRDPEVYRTLEARGIPALVAWAYDPHAAHLSVGFDNRAAMQTLTAEVLRLGHRHIGYISAPQGSNDRARERVCGTRAAITAAGLHNATTLTLIETPYSIDNGAAAFSQIMTAHPDTTVVLCGNDVLAVGALAMARKMGLGVPHDVSITGFDDIELASVVAPALTTVHVPHRVMGRDAARMLVSMLAGNIPDQSRKLETRLCLRETLAPPRPLLPAP